MGYLSNAAATRLSEISRPGKKEIDLPGVRIAAVRVVLVAAFVAVAYQFDWNPLRLLTSEAILRASAVLGMTTERLSSDTIALNGEVSRFITGCTFIHIFAGAIPLLWNLKLSVTRNLMRLSCAAILLFIFNVFRLELSNVLYWGGLSWIYAHEWLAGVSYFVVFLAVWSHGGWLPPGETSQQPATATV